MATWQVFSEYDWYSDGKLPWIARVAIDATSVQAESSTSRLVYNHSDGTKTYVNGSGVSVNGLGDINWTSLSSVEHVATDGSTVIERIDGFAGDISGPNTAVSRGGFFRFILSGDDTLVGSSGRDYLFGGNGRDTFFASSGADDLVAGDDNGSTGTNLYVVQSLADLDVGDRFRGREGTSAGTATLQFKFEGTLDLSSSDRPLLSVHAIQYAQDGALNITWLGDDLRASGSAPQQFIGGDGMDAITINHAVDVSHLTFSNWTPGQDSIVLKIGGDGDRTGTNHNDTFLIHPAANGRARGLDGEDVFVFAGGPYAGVSLDGGNGLDAIRLDAANVDFTAAGNQGLALVERLVFNGGTSIATVLGGQLAAGSIPRVVGSSGIDTFIIKGSADASLVTFTSWTDATDTIKLVGLAGADTLRGSSHNEVIDGGTGADVMSGGAGNDSYVVDVAGDLVDESTGSGTADTVRSLVDFNLTATLLSTTQVKGDVENLTLAGAALNGTGNALPNTIIGNANANTLDGRGGNDKLFGGLGNDTYRVDTGDVVTETGGTDTVIASATYSLTAAAPVEFLRTVDAAATTRIDLTGSSTNNTITGNNGFNILRALGGNDILDGKLGADQLEGGLGNDTYIVDNALERVIETGVGTDTVSASTHYRLAAGLSIETLQTTNAAGTATINLTGNALVQTVKGNNGNNVINGGAGNDRLQGLGGGDSFLFDTAPGASNVDHILDFNPAADTIRLENAIFTGLPNGTLALSAFFAGSAAHDANDRIIYNKVSGVLFFDRDGLGGAAAVQFAILDTKPTLTNVDIFVV